MNFIWKYFPKMTFSVHVEVLDEGVLVQIIFYLIPSVMYWGCDCNSLYDVKWLDIVSL